MASVTMFEMRLVTRITPLHMARTNIVSESPCSDGWSTART